MSTRSLLWPVHVLVRSSFFCVRRTCTCTAHTGSLIVHLHHVYVYQVHCTCLDRVFACISVSYCQYIVNEWQPDRFCGLYMYLYGQVSSVYVVHVLVRPIQAPLLCICITFMSIKYTLHVWIVYLHAYLSPIVSTCTCTGRFASFLPICVHVESWLYNNMIFVH